MYKKLLDLGVRKKERKGLSLNFANAEAILNEVISHRDDIYSTSIQNYCF